VLCCVVCCIVVWCVLCCVCCVVYGVCTCGVWCLFVWCLLDEPILWHQTESFNDMRLRQERLHPEVFEEQRLLARNPMSSPKTPAAKKQRTREPKEQTPTEPKTTTIEDDPMGLFSPRTQSRVDEEVRRKVQIVLDSQRK